MICEENGHHLAVYFRLDSRGDTDCGNMMSFVKILYSNRIKCSITIEI